MKGKKLIPKSAPKKMVKPAPKKVAPKKIAPKKIAPKKVAAKKPAPKIEKVAPVVAPPTNEIQTNVEGQKVELLVHPHGNEFIVTEKGVEENAGSFKTYISPDNPLEEKQ